MASQLTALPWRAQPVVLAHLDADHVDEPVLRRAGEVQPAAHLGDRGADRRDHGAAGHGQLEQHDGAEQLRHVEDAGAEHAHGAGGAHLGHREHEDGAPGLGHQDVRLGHLPVVLQRRDGAVGRRPDGTLAERRPGDRLQDLDHHRRLVGRAHLVLQVLARVLEGDARHLQVAGARVHVAGRDRRPREVDLGHRVVQRHHRGEVGLGALVPLAGEVVEHVGGGAVAGVEHAAGAHRAVVGGVAAGQQDLAGDLAQAALHQVPRQLGLQPRLVDRRAGLLEQRGQGRRVVGDADLLQQAHGLLVDELLLVLAQVLEPRSRHVATSSFTGPGARSVQSFGQRLGRAAAPVLSTLRTTPEQRVALGPGRDGLEPLGQEEARRSRRDPEPGDAARHRLALQLGVERRREAAAPVAVVDGEPVRRVQLVVQLQTQRADEPVADERAPGREHALVVAALVLDPARHAEAAHGGEVVEWADGHGRSRPGLPPADTRADGAPTLRANRSRTASISAATSSGSGATSCVRRISSARAAASATSGRPS